ncbi:MAG: hypothetical protein PHO48_03905 [Candidatus Gracilibacteria bacterium]|nr:hypothetical protein [Candidatus Gracilibacteria bacterium]MDD5179581.1 hypothetical protein [Candidatus Gracilibacteria bacterium]
MSKLKKNILASKSSSRKKAVSFVKRNAETGQFAKWGKKFAPALKKLASE